MGSKRVTLSGALMDAALSLSPNSGVSLRLSLSPSVRLSLTPIVARCFDRVLPQGRADFDVAIEEFMKAVYFSDQVFESPIVIAALALTQTLSLRCMCESKWQGTWLVSMARGRLACRSLGME